MPEAAATTYDLLPYEDYCFPETHPEHLCAVARLLVPSRVAERINLPLNPGDEMVVIAGKAG